MAGRPYGKTPRPRRAKAATPQLADEEILIAIHGRHTLEQLAQELAIAVECLNKAGAYGVEKFRIRLEPRDRKGKPVLLRDKEGEPIRVIQIPEPEIEPPYRPGPYDLPEPVRAPSPKATIPTAPRSPHVSRFNKL